VSDVLQQISTRVTAQTDQARPEQVQNNAGGFVFAVNDLTRVRRFLTLGAEGGTYYVGANALAKDNASAVLRMAKSDPKLLVDTIVEISESGRAPRQNPALFALAAATSVPESRAYALDALTRVARTGTHLFQFAGYVEQFRGWGRAMRSAVGRWYTMRDANGLAYQLTKYRQRDGWSHRDLLRLAHPDAKDEMHAVLFDWACGRGDTPEVPIIEGYVRAQQAQAAELPGIIREYPGLSWEMLPTSALNDRDVWEALLESGMPIGALVRQLPRLTRLGLLEPMSPTCAYVCAQITSAANLKRARIHPVNVLIAMRTYQRGHGRGFATWTPSTPVVDALDTAFYAAFGNVEPTNKRTLLALDVSGSMSGSVSGLPLSCAEASTALALVTAAVEPAREIVGFTAGTADRLRSRSAAGRYALTRLPISPRQRLTDALSVTSSYVFGATDCALPMTWALHSNLEVDTFVIYTDNETYAGSVHPFQALQQYREQTGIAARLAVVGMASTGFSIANPDDSGMLDVAGFDSATPQLLADFARGDV